MLQDVLRSGAQTVRLLYRYRDRRLERIEVKRKFKRTISLTYCCAYDLDIASPPFDMEILLLRVGQIGMVDSGPDFAHGHSLKFFCYCLGILWI